jgi:hypothetical protein
MVNPPLIRPALPTPATARPPMSILEDTAAPQKRDPISKMAKEARKEYLLLNLSYILPQSGWRAALANW